MQITIGQLSTSTQNFIVIDESKSSLLLFDIVSTTFIPEKILSEKKGSKLRSTAELRAFYGNAESPPACYDSHLKFEFKDLLKS